MNMSNVGEDTVGENNHTTGSSEEATRRGTIVMVEGEERDYSNAENIPPTEIGTSVKKLLVVKD